MTSARLEQTQSGSSGSSGLAARHAMPRAPEFWYGPPTAMKHRMVDQSQPLLRSSSEFTRAVLISRQHSAPRRRSAPPRANACSKQQRVSP